MTRADATTKLLTVEEYAAWGERPENADRRTELVEGEVVKMPPAADGHGTICYLIAGHFFVYFSQHPPGYARTNDSGFVVAPNTVRGPDVAVFKQEMKGVVLSGYGKRTPVLCAEVVSPSDRMTQLHKRVKQYHAAGVSVVWVVQPEDRAILVHRKGCPVELIEGDTELTVEPEFPGFRCRLVDLFPPPIDGWP